MYCGKERNAGCGATPVALQIAKKRFAGLLKRNEHRGKSTTGWTTYNAICRSDTVQYPHYIALKWRV